MRSLRVMWECHTASTKQCLGEWDVSMTTSVILTCLCVRDSHSLSILKNSIRKSLPTFGSKIRTFLFLLSSLLADPCSSKMFLMSLRLCSLPGFRGHLEERESWMRLLESIDWGLTVLLTEEILLLLTGPRLRYFFIYLGIIKSFPYLWRRWSCSQNCRSTLYCGIRSVYKLEWMIESQH